MSPTHVSGLRELMSSLGHTATAADEDLGACASRPMPGGWPGLYVLNGKEDTHAFQYVHLGFERFAADGRSFVIEFNVNVGEKWRVTVHGRKLWPVFLNVHHHKLEWIARADRDFEDGKPVITAIVVEPVPESESRSAPVRRQTVEEGAL